MKQICVGCNNPTKFTFNIFGTGEPCFIPLCKPCQKKTIIEIGKTKRRNNMSKARDNRWTEETRAKLKKKSGSIIDTNKQDKPRVI